MQSDANTTQERSWWGGSWGAACPARAEPSPEGPQSVPSGSVGLAQPQVVVQQEHWSTFSGPSHSIF